MRLLPLLFGGSCLVPSALGLPQIESKSVTITPRPERAQAVKEAFEFAWDGYFKYAFPNDELHPVSNGFGNSRNGWGASAIDALSTALVMRNKKIVNEILDFVPTINYAVSKDNELVSLFETTIRYLGGMLSAYDFLTGPLASLAENKGNVNQLLTQAENLAGNLSYAFDTHSGVPSNNLNFGAHTTDGSKTNGLATIGTLVLEWTHLSDLTGKPKYGQLAQKGESYLLNPRPISDEPYPGLLGTDVGLYAGRFHDNFGGWVGGDDSFYEYLIKMYVYDQSKFGHYKDRWVKAVDSSIAHLASHPSSRPDLTYLAEFQGKKRINESEHLACFDGGNFILGGTVLKRDDITNFGLKLVEGCHNTYISTATKIGPEIFSWNTTTLPAAQKEFYHEHGFWISDSLYDLRPEVLESYYYAYKATGDSKYQDWSWDAFMAINATCRVGSGFAALNNVNVAGGGGFIDNQESFLFAEVMKYAYLIQSAEEPWDFNAGGENKWVYNTEAHPFRVAGTPI